MRVMIAAIFCILTCINGAFSQVAVIANTSVPVDQIEKNELENFYTGDIRKWNNGEPIIVFDLKAKGEVQETFYNFLGKSTSRMKSIWMKNMLSGEGDPPESIPSEEEVLKKVASTPGAIGFVSQAKTSEDVKILIVIRKENGS